MTVALSIMAVVVLAGIFLFTTARRDRSAAGVDRRGSAANGPAGDGASGERSRELVPVGADGGPGTGREVERAAALERRGGGAGLAPPAPSPVPATVDEEAYGVTRRQFLNRSVFTMMGLSLSAFGAACLAFLWPSLSGGFGSKIKAGSLQSVLSQMESKKEPFYVPEGRFYLNPYPQPAIDKAKKVYSAGIVEGMQQGVVALYQKCVHLGCRVPWCKSSQWFECPCHGSKYNRVGEKKGGPAPRGLDRFAVSVDGGQIVVDTKTVVLGPVIGTDTTGQEQEGPHCA
jgi:cytochrome b6-f complex iron-sulfur subunit